MVDAFSPLVWNVPIVNPDGTPTPQFILILQNALKALDDGTGTLDDVFDAPIVMTSAPSPEFTAESILTAGTGIDIDLGGGLATINLDDTTVTPDTYGDATNIPQITVDQQGRITAAIDIPVSIPSGGVDVEDEGSPIITGATTLNFTGNVVVTDAGSGVAEIDIPVGDPAWKVDATGTGASQDVTLPFSGLTDEEVLVFVNGIRYEVDEYSISGTTLTLTTNASGDSIEIVGELGSSGGGGGGGGSSPLKASVTFKYDGSLTIFNSFNVSAINRFGAGSFEVVFDTALPDILEYNISMASAFGPDPSFAPAFASINRSANASGGITSTSIFVTNATLGGTTFDPNYFSVRIEEQV